MTIRKYTESDLAAMIAIFMSGLALRRDNSKP